MPVDYVQGKDVIIRALAGGVYRQIACYTSCSLAVDTEDIETTTKTIDGGINQSGKWRQFRNTVSTWNMTCEGLLVLDSDLRFDDVRKFGIDGIPLLVMFSMASVSGTRYSSWMGYANVVHSENSGGVSGVAPYRLNLKGNGELQADFNPINLNAPMENYRYYTCDGTEGYQVIFPDMIGFIPNGRIGRGGQWYEPSGNLITGRDASADPGLYQYQWAQATGKLTFSTDFAPLAAGEKLIIPFVPLYSGCSLYISGLTVYVDSNNFFYLQWNGTGIPENQLSFEFSADYGASWTVAGMHVDSIALNNATYEQQVDISQSYIWRMTPICTNGAKGMSTLAYWNTVIIHLTNNRTDGVDVVFINYIRQNNQGAYLGAQNNGDNSQKTLITNNASPKTSGGSNITLTITLGSAIESVQIKDMKDNLIGSGSGNGTIACYVANGVPNEFKIILN